jgi:hypothetical protein
MKFIIYLTLFLLPTVAFSQCIPPFEKPIEIGENEDISLEIDASGTGCSECGMLLFSTDSAMSLPFTARRENGKYTLTLSSTRLHQGEQTVYYALRCGGSLERGEIRIVVVAETQSNEPFTLVVLDVDAYKQKKPFRVQVSAKGFPTAMVTCSGCKDISLSSNGIYLITPGYASSIELTINGVTAQGDFQEVAVRRLDFQ